MVLRVLISAYACEPGKGSEPGVGWNWVRQAARFHEVWVITRANNRPPIEEALARQPLPHVRFVYFDLPRWARFWKKGQHGVRVYYYLCWQVGAYLVVRRLHRDVGFDLVHHVTIGIHWMPSLLSLLPVPLCWGPLGGGESAPACFRRSFSVKGRLYEMLRDFARILGERDPLVRLTARRSALAVAKTHCTEARLQRLGCRNTLVLSEAGISGEELDQLSRLPVRYGPPFRAASFGRLLHWKGYEFGLKAFARLYRGFPDSEYWLFGDGPERRRLERLARQLAVDQRVVFWGARSRHEVFEKLAQCDVLLHPSLHDSGGWVCLEAMAAGRPVICLDLAGPALQVTAETGIKVPAISPEQVVCDLASALLLIARDPALRAQLGQKGRRRVQELFSWEHKGDLWSRAFPRIEAGIP